MQSSFKFFSTNLDDKTMIAASEPLEFIPHGRTVLENHPGKIYGKVTNNSLTENSLLYKLTNFAIKDETFLDHKDGEEKEWWCIREVYARCSDEFNEDPEQTPKETKDENMSESFRPQSRLKNDFNISIKSELLTGVRRMDTDATANPGGSRGGSANSSSNMSKKFNLGSGQSKSPKKVKPLNPKSDSCYEEELFVKGCTAVWSKGLISTPGTRLSGPETRETIACYTIENPIKHAIFCNFHISVNNTMLIDALNSQIGDEKKNIKIEDTTEHIPTKIMPSILLIDNKCMRVFAKDGREYVTSIPFQVKRTWAMKYGVLLEKHATQLIHNSLLPTSLMKLNESQNSTFSRSRNYPQSMSAKLRAESLSGFDQDVPLPTCFSLSHPLDEVTPILMKTPSGLNYYNDGDLQIIFVSSNPSIILLYDWKLGTHSLWKIRKAFRDECLSMCPNMNSTTTVFSQSCDYANSPLNARNTAMGSPLHSKRGPSTPTHSRVNSPIANVFHQQGLSPHGSIYDDSMIANTVHQTPPSLPLYPDICLDHIWTEAQTTRRDPIENSSDMKSFLHTDLVGHNYLCYIIKVGGLSRLQIVRLQKSNAHGHGKANIIVGHASLVSARDAVVLEHLKMIAVIDESGNIILQSGTSVVGKVHVGGVLARLIDSPYTKRSAFQSPFPRRSSLLPSRSNDVSVFDDSALHLLSPVPHSSASRIDQKESLGLQGLCDAAGNRLTLQFDKGSMYRITLPDMACSTLVNKCCAALKGILPKDVTMQVTIKWYGVRNAPGTQDLTPEQEWTMFANLLLSLIGYDLEKLSLPKKMDEQAETSEVATKKLRTSSDGTQDDWDYLLNSKLHKTFGNSLSSILHLSQTGKSEIKHSKPSMKTKKLLEEKLTSFNSNSALFPYVIQVLFAFHLVYEETKLNTLLLNDLPPLSNFLYQLAKDLKLERYVTHYWLDYPTNHVLEFEEADSQISEANLKKLSQPSYFSAEPPNFFAYMNSLLKGVDVGYYPYLPDVNTMSRDLIEVLTTLNPSSCSGVQTISSNATMAGSSTPRAHNKATSHGDSLHSAAVLMMHHRGITTRDIDNLPPAIGLLMVSVINACRLNPPLECVELLGRLELSADSKTQECHEGLEGIEKESAYTICNVPTAENFPKPDDKEAEMKTGMEHLDTKLLRLLYPRDHRIAEVFSLLQSSRPVPINLTQRPEVSDHDFIEEQEKYLYAVSTRTMALPVGRGMLTLRTLPCVPTEPFLMPKLVVSGVGPPPRHNAVELGGAGAGESPPHCVTWPSFHNGAAAGLALLPRDSAPIDPSAVLFNRLKGSADQSNEHGGFLLALGLNGHLKDMPFMNIYEYLVKSHEMTSIGLLLGLAATYRGTMDLQATKMLSIHVEGLLGSTSLELDIQQHILVAALLGIGLLYQGTNTHHLASTLLKQIGKPPGPETENCYEREGYALSAGLALGMVCVGAADSAPPHVPHALRAHMLGGEKCGTQKDKFKQGTYGIREAPTVNLDVTAPGATLALGLVYWASGNQAAAKWLQPPHTGYLLDFVRPDLLMLRCIARGLILWHDIEPTEEWVESQVPPTIKKHCFVKPTEDNIDYEAMNQAYCNIVGGACFAMGLRFAGSGCEEARDTLLLYTNQLITLAGRSIGELAGKSTLESCMCVCLLAAGMVMAGRGDLSVLRVCRRLRARVPTNPASPHAPPLTHGGQMAVHSTLGLIFLGGGRCTLSTSATSVAALLTAFFPKFPTHSVDNRYHLQAFRHLYVLAVEPRLILPRDLDTGKLCYAHVKLVDLSGAEIVLKAPCMLPELDQLKEVKISDPRYWPVIFQRDKNWDQLQKYLEHTWCVDIKQRAGCLSYLDDPQGFLTLLAQTLTLDRANIWSATPTSIQLFTNDEKVRSFTKHYLESLDNWKRTNVGANVCADCMLLERRKAKSAAKACQCRQYCEQELQFVQGLSMATCECVLRDALQTLPAWITFLKIIKTMKTDPWSYHMWQIKLLLSQIENHNRKQLNTMRIDGQESQDNDPLISNEFTTAIVQKVENTFDGVEEKLKPYLRKYVGLSSSGNINSCEESLKKTLSSFLVFYDMPRAVLNDVAYDNTLSVLVAMEGLNLSASTVSKVDSML